ncbi:MAG TPA: MerR family DNA-binding protein [Microvirga sp.]|nr:MerR family DNA-binding protein [Microvirga sp.]
MPPRTQGKQRRYGADDVSRLDFIRHARDLGFDVEAIRELLELGKKPDQSCAEAGRIARRHMVEVERRIEQLMTLRAELRRMIEECSHERVGECRVIQVLADHSQCAHERH